MSVTPADLIVMAPELAGVDTATLQTAIDATPQMVNLERFAEKAELLQKYLALHILALMGFGKARDGRVASKSAGGVSISYAVTASSALKSLDSTTWGSLYRMVVRTLGLRGAVT